MHEFIVKAIFIYIIIAGVLGLLGDIYRVAFLRFDTSLGSSNKLTRLVYRYFLFSSSYLIAYLLVTPFIYRAFDNFQFANNFGSVKYYLDFAITAPIAALLSAIGYRINLRRFTGRNE